MRIGVPKESAEGERRVALVPDSVASLMRSEGVVVSLVAGAGAEAGLTPRARIVSAAVSGADPTILLTGPAPASRNVPS